MNVEWKLEKAVFAEFNLPNVATLQFDSCGLNLTCLDQCHGVRSHGTSSSQGWRTIIVIQHFKGWSMSYIRVFNQPALCRNAKENLLAETGICRHQCFSAVVETPQDSPSGYFRKKELDGTIEPIAPMNVESWRQLSLLSSNCQHVATLQFDSCAEKDTLCGRVMMAWISHVWINAMVFVPLAQAPPKTGAKYLLYSLQSKIDPWVYTYIHLHPCFQPTCLCREGQRIHPYSPQNQ